MAVTERGRFANSYDFLVAVAAFAVGPFVLRLPYTIFVFGGAFLFFVCTTLLAVFVTVPLTSIELSIGHITGLAPTAAFAAISPRLRTVGWAQAAVCAILLAKVSAEAARYLFLTVVSFTDLTWWTGCGNEWNSIDCESITNIYECLIRNGDYHAPRHSAERAVCQLPGGPAISLSRPNATASTVRSHVVFGGLQFASHFLVDNTVNWSLTGVVAVVWLLILAVTACGPRAIGKALYPLVFLPLLLLFIVNVGIRTVDTLPYPAKVNAEDNSLFFFLTPSVQHASSLHFYVQSLMFVSAGFGVYTVLASFHKHTETTTEQLTPRWKPALAAPWVAVLAIFLNVLLELGFSLGYLVILLFVIAVGLFYGWYDLQKDTALALGEPEQTSILSSLLMPSSQYHTGFLLLICPVFVGVALANTPLFYFYQLFETDTTFDAKQVVGTIISILFLLFLAVVAVLAVIDCDRHMRKLPYVCYQFPRLLSWNPIRCIPEKHQSYTPPMGNSNLLWLLYDYNTALIYAFFIEMIGTAIAIGLAILWANVFWYYYVAIFAAIFNVLLSAWCLLGIYRAKTYRRSEYLIPFLLAKITLAVLFPLAMYDPSRPGHLLLVCIAFIIFEGILVAIAVGAHWQYRRLQDPARLLHNEYLLARAHQKEPLIIH
uniref:Uncharacterized protein n=1 Tax=Plectus sambesii TaxID=2011161 RepID=A0A914VWV5_9BILA